ncbi:hypothetical protein [Spongiibacter tropicus]|uniref:hypothetical protein n=1 Tax=Spongiibacter tropicus TaxID=454602 RepID=UPI0003B61D4A|nr:hypothetical protein [Spongiibacter tropicus]
MTPDELTQTLSTLRQQVRSLTRIVTRLNNEQLRQDRRIEAVNRRLSRNSNSRNELSAVRQQVATLSETVELFCDQHVEAQSHDITANTTKRL